MEDANASNAKGRLDRMHAVEDHSRATILALSEALEQSTSREQFVYREAELDDLWRIVSTALDLARNDTRRRDETAQLTDLLAVVQAAHDRVGSDENPRAAAALLRSATA